MHPGVLAFGGFMNLGTVACIGVCAPSPGCRPCFVNASPGPAPPFSSEVLLADLPYCRAPEVQVELYAPALGGISSLPACLLADMPARCIPLHHEVAHSW